MKEIKYLIIGGGIAGTTAADTIRKNDADGSVAIVSDEPHRLYSRIMISKPSVFLEKVPFEQIWLKEEGWYKENNIEFLSGKKAVSLDTKEKIVRLDDEEEIKYEKLLLAIGACARRLPVPGVEKKGIFHVRILEDAKDIMEASKSAKKAVVVGGSFIGFEMADLLRQKDIDVSMVFNTENCWEPALDKASSKIVEGVLEKGGVKIYGGQEIKEILDGDKGKKVVLKDGTELKCDMVVFGVGVSCPHDWLKKALDVKRGILTNEYLEASASDVWAAGDSCEFKDTIIDDVIILGTWINAQEQGRTAGLNMVGQKQAYKNVTFYTTRGFDIAVAFVGDASPADNRERVVRVDAEKKISVQFFVKNGRIVGATTINRVPDVQVITKLIEKQIDISDKMEELADPSFELKKLL
ncbi:MAG: FAD-dependent oxidoreductase [Patescibacteria group bacterium]